MENIWILQSDNQDLTLLDGLMYIDSYYCVYRHIMDTYITNQNAAGGPKDITLQIGKIGTLLFKFKSP